MRLRRFALKEDRGATVAVWDEGAGAWVPLAPAIDAAGVPDDLGAAARDVVAFVAGGERVREGARAVIDAVRPRAGELAATVDDRPLLPFAARSFRAFSLWERHMVDAARTLVRRFLPPVQGRAVAVYERVTRRTFPMLKPPKLFYERPLYYLGNHTAFVTDGEEVRWPRYTDALDYELELGFVLAHPVLDADARAGRDAIGAFFVVNDFSARDTQAREAREGLFGPVIKAKGFANGMSAEVVTADELLDRVDRLAGEVRVNGEVWSRGSTAGAQHDVGEMVAYASLGEQLAPGDVLATGTLPGCSGMEIDRWLQPGDEVEATIEGVASLRNRIGAKGKDP